MANALAQRVNTSVQIFNPEQLEIYNRIMDAVTSGQPLCLFVKGKADVGKTTLVNTVCDKVRSLGRIVLPMATSGFAAQLFNGGQTVHSTFKVRNGSYSREAAFERLTSYLMILTGPCQR